MPLELLLFVQTCGDWECVISSTPKRRLKLVPVCVSILSLFLFCRMLALRLLVCLSAS